jgi:hypothetical protein
MLRRITRDDLDFGAVDLVGAAVFVDPEGGGVDTRVGEVKGGGVGGVVTVSLAISAGVGGGGGGRGSFRAFLLPGWRGFGGGGSFGRSCDCGIAGGFFGTVGIVVSVVVVFVVSVVVVIVVSVAVVFVVSVVVVFVVSVVVVVGFIQTGLLNGFGGGDGDGGGVGPVIGAVGCSRLRDES